jgi:hypothetical protein
MSQGCCAGHDRPQPTARLACPQNGQVGRPVPTVTLGALLRPQARRQLKPEQTYWFCPAPDCETVYYTNDGAFRISDVAVPVWQKQPGPTTPVCYCFGWTPEKIRAASNRPMILTDITRQVKAGNCYCEVTNPQGACCLGNVTEAIKSANAERG